MSLNEAVKNLSRREALHMGVAATAAACSSDPTPTPTGDAAADAPGADVTGNDTAAQPDAPGPDAAPPPDVAPPIDAAPACPPAGAMRLGAVSDFPVGSWRNVKAAAVIVGRDARGLFAYTSVCTHNGCTVPAPGAGAGSTCPCHGSQYNSEGMVTGGPAMRSLDNYRVVVCGTDVYLQMSMVVPVGTRTAV